MGSKQFSNWLERIFNTQSEEISCSECFDNVSGYVELELSGKAPEEQFPQVKHHLDQCPACREEYETLRDLRRLEDGLGIPSIDDLKSKIH